MEAFSHLPAPPPLDLGPEPSQAAQDTFDCVIHAWLRGETSPRIGALGWCLGLIAGRVDRLEVASAWATAWGLDDSVCWMRPPGQECGRVRLHQDTSRKWSAWVPSGVDSKGEPKSWRYVPTSTEPMAGIPWEKVRELVKMGAVRVTSEPLPGEHSLEVYVMGGSPLP